MDAGKKFSLMAAVRVALVPDADRDATSPTPLPLVLAGAAVVLVIMVVVQAVVSIRRSEEAMSNLMAEKGSSLIMAFENILRTGRRTAGVRMQAMFEEMASSPDIRFVTVTMPDGTIIAHSDPERLGGMLRIHGTGSDKARLGALAPQQEAKWAFMEMEGEELFVVYRHFTPGLQGLPKGYPVPVIFLGLDVSPFAITRSQNRSYIIMLSAAVLLVGLLCLLAIHLYQHARASRQRQHLAEDKVRRLEDEVRRREKLAAVGNLAAGVAHEIRNPLSSIKGYATYFGQLFAQGSEESKAAGVMVSEVDRLNRVVTELIGLSHPSDVQCGPVHLERVAEDVLRLVQQDAGRRGVRLHLRCGRHLPAVMADAGRLTQALLNLCINGMDAMPGGGSLTLAVSAGRKNACISLRDTGQGIAPQDMPRIFDPYFSTKGQGTGLGLATVHKIVEAHHGTIGVHSQQGPDGTCGTIFHLRLPIGGTAAASKGDMA